MRKYFFLLAVIACAVFPQMALSTPCASNKDCLAKKNTCGTVDGVHRQDVAEYDKWWKERGALQSCCVIVDRSGSFLHPCGYSMKEYNEYLEEALSSATCVYGNCLVDLATYQSSACEKLAENISEAINKGRKCEHDFECLQIFTGTTLEGRCWSGINKDAQNDVKKFIRRYSRSKCGVPRMSCLIGSSPRKGKCVQKKCQHG